MLAKFRENFQISVKIWFTEINSKSEVYQHGLRAKRDERGAWEQQGTERGEEGLPRKNRDRGAGCAPLRVFGIDSCFHERHRHKKVF